MTVWIPLLATSDMSPALKYSVRNLLTATGFLALACMALVRPSVVWVAALPILYCVLLTFSTHLAFASPKKTSRIYWTSFIVGSLAFVLSSAAVGMAITIAGHSADILRFEIRSYFEMAFQLIHKDIPLRNAASRELSSFACSLLLMLAVVLPGMAAFIAHLLTKQPEEN